MVHIDTDTTTQPNAVRLLVEGELDALAVGAFNAAITRAARLHRPVELDLSEVDFIDGSGLSTLMNAASRARRAGYELTIAEVSRQVRRLVEITDTADRLPPLPPTNDGRQAQTGRRFVSTAAAAAGTPAFKI